MDGSCLVEGTAGNCFCKAGVLNPDMSVVERSDDDPFADMDGCIALQSLRNEAVIDIEVYPLKKYVNGEEDLPVCREIDDSSWESSPLFLQL